MERTHSRPRSKSAFSFRSDRSTPSKHESLSKESTGAVSDDRRKSQLASATKANPNAAMNEAQPSTLVAFARIPPDESAVAAALEAPTLQPLRSLQHTDAGGNPISELPFHLVVLLNSNSHNALQRNPICRTQHALDGSALWTLSGASKQRSIANTDAELLP